MSENQKLLDSLLIARNSLLRNTRYTSPMIRPAVQADIPSIARVHVQAWRETYAGLIPQEVLDNLSTEERAAMWRGALSEHATSLLVYEHEGEVVGFAAVGPEREKHALYTGELYAIYLLKAFHGQGYGGALFHGAVRSLKGQGRDAMRLWVLEENPTRGFYEHLGGELHERKTLTFVGTPLTEVAYGWAELPDFASSGQ